MRKIIMAVAAVAVVGALAACSAAPNSELSDTGAGDWDAVVAENPSDPYVASYEEGDASTLIGFHKALGKTCADCHEDETMTLVGSFDEVAQPAADNAATREFCLNEGCHNWDNIKDSTILDGESTVYNPDAKYNVHVNHRGEENCGTCHSMHGQSELKCVECHYLDMPEGWIGFE